MVANDGRGSLRGLLHRAGKRHDEEYVSEFKALVARHLGPLCSAMLVDLGYGRPALRALAEWAPATGRVISVDAFDEPEFGPLSGSTLDREGLDDAAEVDDVVALKLFLFWNPDEEPDRRQVDAADFVKACDDRGMLSLLEGVVQVPADHPRLDEYLVRAAAEFGEFGPDLYKTQVPSLGRLDVESIEEVSRRVTEAVGVPWVALSNGVSAERFPEMVGAVCRGGASGFLAGRATWSPAIQAPDPDEELRTDGASRLENLTEAVDRYARPWWVAASLPAPDPASPAAFAPEARLDR